MRALSESISVSGHRGIDVGRPALDAPRERLGALDALKAQPGRGIQAAHAVMAVANYFVHAEKSVYVCGQGAERHQLGAFNPAQIVFPWLADIDEDELFAAIHSRFHVCWRYLQFVQGRLIPP